MVKIQRSNKGGLQWQKLYEDGAYIRSGAYSKEVFIWKDSLIEKVAFWKDF